MSRVLITGAAGFIGSYLVRYHLNNGDFVFGLDNFSTGHKRNIQDIEEPNWSFMEDDVITANLPKDVDYIYHFASPASPPKFMARARETMQVNTLGTWRLIDHAAENEARLLFASTSEVYGDPLVHPQPESYWGNVNPIGPRSVYDEAKRFGETLISNANSSGHANAAIVRIFNTYGPRMDPWDGRVVSTFIRQALKNEPFTIFGTGEQTRSFCYAEDLVTAICAVMDSNLPGPINLGNPEEFSLLKLAEVVSEVLKIKPQITFDELPVDDPKQRKPDISLARQALAWSPTVSLHEGVERTAHWMRKILC